MLHRNLNHQNFTLAAIDNIIGRGKKNDWAELRSAVLNDARLLKKVHQVCLAHTDDPFAQRYHFWNQYVEKSLA